MAETEGVSRFKEFSRAALLTALREAGGDELQKEQAYLQIRQAFTSEYGWPDELDEIEPGPAQTPRWRNRLHWVVAEFVRRGLLEPSEGQDLIRPTSLGRAIVRLPPPFRDTPETRALIEAVQSAQHDEERSTRLRQLLDEFQNRFPPDQLQTMSVDQYVMGGGGRDNFCWWLERGLEQLGRYSPGSSRGHLIYRMRDGEIYRNRNLRDVSLEEAMARVAGWHAKVIEIGRGDDPEQIDEGAAGSTGMPSRTLKLLHSYFPGRFLPINSMDHLARFLRAFGVMEDAIPDGAVARNRLLFRLYEALAQPQELDTEEFMQILYDRFDPRPVNLDETRLRGAIRLFTWYYGGDCASDRFVREERDYKIEISERWQTVADVDDLAAALEGGNVVEKARDLAKALLDPPSNFLNYRYQEPLRGLTEPSDARLFLEAVLDLLGSAGSDEGVPDVSRFNERMSPLYERLDPSARIAASRSIPTLLISQDYTRRIRRRI